MPGKPNGTIRGLPRCLPIWPGFRRCPRRLVRNISPVFRVGQFRGFRRERPEKGRGALIRLSFGRIFPHVRLFRQAHTAANAEFCNVTVAMTAIQTNFTHVLIVLLFAEKVNLIHRRETTDL